MDKLWIAGLIDEATFILSKKMREKDRERAYQHLVMDDNYLIPNGSQDEDTRTAQ